MNNVNYTKDNFSVTNDKELLNIEVIYSFLSSSTWANGISKKMVIQSINNSLCFGLFDNKTQIGFARVITDYTTFAYLCDVFVLEEYRGLGLGLWLTECILSYEIFPNMRRILLATKTAAWLYQKVGFQPINEQNYLWHIHRPNIYNNSK